MIKIIEERFEMVHTSGPFFDLYQLVKVNEGKENEREEMKLTDYGIPFDTCLKKVVHFQLSDKEYTLKEYVTAYKEAVDRLKNLLEITPDEPKKKIKKNDQIIENAD